MSARREFLQDANFTKNGNITKEQMASQTDVSLYKVVCSPTVGIRRRSEGITNMNTNSQKTNTFRGMFRSEAEWWMKEEQSGTDCSFNVGMEVLDWWS